MIMLTLPATAVVVALPEAGFRTDWRSRKRLEVCKLNVPWQPEWAMGTIAGRSLQTLGSSLNPSSWHFARGKAMP